MPLEFTSDNRPSHNTLFKWVVVALLASIQFTLVVILLRMPVSAPTISDLKSAKNDETRSKLIQKIPLVHVSSGTIDANIIGTVDVEVHNTPLEVQIQR